MLCDYIQIGKYTERKILLIDNKISKKIIIIFDNKEIREIVLHFIVDIAKF